MQNIQKEFGKHYMVEFIECNPNKLKRVETIQKELLEAARVSKATVINHFFHQFEPMGVTGIILIAESHFSIHTWPQDCYAAFDILTCGNMDAHAAIDLLKKHFEAKQVTIKTWSRGIYTEDHI